MTVLPWAGPAEIPSAIAPSQHRARAGEARCGFGRPDVLARIENAFVDSKAALRVKFQSPPAPVGMLAPLH
jgi:hypothetical protein